MLHSSLPLPVQTFERITLLQGQALATADAGIEYTTVLGSCVASCLFDPQAQVGGMNHFLLAEPPRGAGIDEHYGVYLMEVLINAMLKLGASRGRMRAHLYGGANMHAAMARIGSMNAEFARRFLIQEGIPLVREDLGGTNARRVDFRPTSGRVRCRHAAPAMAPAPRPNLRPTPATTGDVELF